MDFAVSEEFANNSQNGYTKMEDIINFHMFYYIEQNNNPVNHIASII